MSRLVICIVICIFVSTSTATAFANGQVKTDAVRDFASRTYIHGVPYKEAHSLGKAALPELEGMLAVEANKEYWRTITATIAYIGEPSSFGLLRDFMLTRFHGEIDDPTFTAMLSIMTSLGPMAAKSDEVFQFLVDGTDPKFWSAIPWTNRNHKGAYLREFWSELSINSMTLSGRHEVTSVLERLEKKPFVEGQKGNIKQGFETHREVQALGIEGYFESHKGVDGDK